MTGVVDGCEWSPLCVVGVRPMSGEWMDGGDLWTLIPLSFHSFHSSITLILFTFSLIQPFLITLSYQHSFSFHSSLVHFCFILSFTPYTLSLSLCLWWWRCDLFHPFTHSLFILIYQCHFIHPFYNHLTSFTSYSFLFITFILMSYHFIHLSLFIITSIITWLSLTHVSSHSCSFSIPFYHSISFYSLSYTFTIHHSELSVLNTLYSILLLSTPYTLYYHHVSFIYYSVQSTTHSSSNSSSLKTHSHYPSITLIYNSFSIPFSILYYSPLSQLHFILFIQSYHEHSAISHKLYTTLYQSFYFDFSLSLFYLSILISYYSFINTYYYSFHTHSISHSFILFISFITLKQLSQSISLIPF